MSITTVAKKIIEEKKIHQRFDPSFVVRGLMLEDPTFWRMHTLANLMDYIGEIYTQEANTIYLYIVR